MAHPFSDHRQSKVERSRASRIAKGYATGGAVAAGAPAPKGQAVQGKPALATGGGLVFAGALDRYFRAYDDKTGKVVVTVQVTEGPRWEVAEVRFSGGEGAGVTLDFGNSLVGEPWTPLWQQDLRERVRRAFYAAGFPEMSISLSTQPGTESGGRKPLAVTAAIVAGPRVQVGQVHFQGNERTRESVLRRRVTAKPGDPLDPISLERSRYRISRLGVFSEVDLRYQPADGQVRDPVFVLREAPRREANLLLGYGSYEQIRAGIEFRQLNLFGLAHLHVPAEADLQREHDHLGTEVHAQDLGHAVHALRVLGDRDHVRVIVRGGRLADQEAVGDPREHERHAPEEDADEHAAERVPEAVAGHAAEDDGGETFLPREEWAKPRGRKSTRRRCGSGDRGAADLRPDQAIKRPGARVR